MKLYNSLGPNPRMVRMFLHEKGLEIPMEEVDLMGGENRRAPYTDKNPGGQLPSLELDDGTVIAEVTAICEYLEDTHPQPPLIGSSAPEKAETRMWTRRLDLNVLEPMGNGFRYGDALDLFKDRIPTVPEAATGLKRVAQDRLRWIDGMIQGRDYLCGSRFTMADILLFSFLDFFSGLGQAIDPACSNVAALYERVAARPSAQASLHSVSAAAGMK